MSGTAEFRDLTGLAAALKVSLGVYMAIAAIGLLVWLARVRVAAAGRE